MNNSPMIQYQTRHEEVLRQLIAEADIPSPLLNEAILYSLFPGGKRLRPMLVYLCGEILQVALAPLDIIAAAIELTHCYSLIHDDLPAMDDDDFRRGKPSCHKAFDEATAILAGDGLQAFAIDILLTHLPNFFEADRVLRITRELTKACGLTGMVSGQALDLYELSKTEISEKRLTQIHSLKTGQLISACINMVLSAGNPSTAESKDLQSFAQHLGLVFQMQDDYLDKYSTTDCLGKGRSSDIANQKTTFATIFNQEQLYTLINEHYNEAKLKLASFGSQASALLALIDYLHQRSNTTNCSASPT